MTVQYAKSLSADTWRKPSGSIWGDCPMEAIERGDGHYISDDFTTFSKPGTQTSELQLGPVKVYNTGSGAVITDSFPNGTPGYPGGVISMLCDTAGDQSVIATHACPFSLSTSGSAGKLWFEARIAVTSIATNMTHVFVGLGNSGDVTLGAAIPLADANATGTAVALLGWTRLEDGLGVLNTSYTDEAASYTHVETSAGSIAANTFVKLGFVFDPIRTSDCVTFFVNGVPTTTPMTRATLAALTHLDNSNLGPIFAQFADSAGTACYAYMDWWRCYQRSV